MVYLPLLEESGTVPSMKYVFAPEIHAHAERMAERWDLHRRCLLSTQVSGLEWVDESRRWRVVTDRGDEILARFVTMGTGPLHRPKLPGIPGLETFEGPLFHTARWDYGLTGGDPSGAPLTALRDRRVGIIGTGATAVQVVPMVARDAGELFVFQRTPSSIDVRNNTAIEPDGSPHCPGLADDLADELRRAPDRGRSRGGPGPGRLDRHLEADLGQDPPAGRRR